jgi:hypothetical protein
LLSPCASPDGLQRGEGHAAPVLQIAIVAAAGVTLDSETASLFKVPKATFGADEVRKERGAAVAVFAIN